ncbi:hypothetical protein AC249_AIPGENE10777 [Exaiptasia diaphana]|nr:hypothetical protein AC249_AIPGENE10777 [Exaiptasia diaphana]
MRYDRLFFRDSSQMSSPVFLHRCAFYRLEAYTVTERGYEHLSVGLRMAEDGTLSRPISGSLLQRTLTGNRTFSLSFKDNSQRVTVHVNSVVISAFATPLNIDLWDLHFMMTP